MKQEEWQEDINVLTSALLRRLGCASDKVLITGFNAAAVNRDQEGYTQVVGFEDSQTRDTILSEIRNLLGQGDYPDMSIEPSIKALPQYAHIFNLTANTEGPSAYTDALMTMLETLEELDERLEKAGKKDPGIQPK